MFVLEQYEWVLFNVYGYAYKVTPLMPKYIIVLNPKITLF